MTAIGLSMLVADDVAAGIIVTSQISSSPDDAEEAIVLGTDASGSSLVGRTYTDSSDVELASDADFLGIEQMVGLRFQNIAVPKGATINSASIAFTVDDLTDSTPSKQAGHDANGFLNFFGQLSSNAATFSASNFNISNTTSRPRTTATVVWNSPTWTTGAVNDVHSSADLSSIVSEITGQSGWVSGNSLAFFVTVDPGTNITREAESFDGDASEAPILTIEYTTAVPEPSTFAIMGLALIGMAGYGWRRKRKAA
jgi:hypothetical protein